ncbi:MAG: ParB/RepB/Spo0J family partition protein [Fibrobacteria bacterium]|nr:ParB/RepB/Spo0J family partition protein [Fibrobacteria bacterium]
MNKPRGLGKGLGAIFQEKTLAHRNDMHGVAPPDGSTVEIIPLEKLSPNPFQPRKEFDAEGLAELSASIREKGVLQPILVRRQGENFQIIAGERRFRASQMAGKDAIPALVRDQVTDREMREDALIENIIRVQLNAIEEAEAYQELVVSCGYTHEQLSERLGRSRPTITNSLRLLKLHPDVRASVVSGDLSAGHARVLAPLPEDRQLALGRMAVANHWSVRTLEQESGASAPPKKNAEKPKPPQDDPNTTAFVRSIEERLGTRIQLDRSKDGKGSLRIHFLSDVDLNRIADILLGHV